MSFLIKTDRPVPRPSYWHVVGNHFPVFLITGAVLAAAFLIPADKFPFLSCFFKRCTGYPCPTCGFTRAFCDFACGNWPAGLQNCPFAVIVFVFTLFLFVYNAAALFAGIFGIRIQYGSLFQLTPRRLTIIISVLVVLLLANWIYRLVTGLK
jgi:hypothetical protein